MRSSVVVPGLLTAAIAMHTVAAQCDPVLQPGAAVAGVLGSVRATTPWDPDGAGPLGEHLVVGGSFTIAGDVRARGIALFDPATNQWSSLGNLDGQVNALVVMPNGDLVAGGAFLQIGTTDARCLVRWDGTAWSTLGGGVSIPGGMTNRDVRSLLLLPNGDLIVGGQFGLAGGPAGIPVGSIARWDGTTWHAMGDLFIAFFLPSCDALAVLPNGDVVAGGMFVSAGGVACNHVARWNGATWDAMGGGVTSIGLGYLRTLSLRANGDLIAGGFFSAAGGLPAQNIARWNGSSWSSLGAGLADIPFALRELPNGDLLAGVDALPGIPGVVRWDGVAWSGFGSLPPGVSSLTLSTSGELFAGGTFRPAGAFVGRGIARWNGSDWTHLTAGNDGAVDEVLALDDGSFLVLGDIRGFGGVSVTRAAIFDGQSWRPAGAPIAGSITGFPTIVHSAAVAMPGGAAAIAVPTYQHAINPYHTIQRWDGTAWQTIGVATRAVRTMAVAPNGDLWVGGEFEAIDSTPAADIAVWNGSTWSQGPTTPSSVYALFFQRNGQLVAGGTFPGGVAAWNGSQWTPLGGGLQQPATGFAQRPNGDLVAIGNWVTVNGSPCVDIARWDGAAWHPLGTGVGVSFGSGDLVSSVVGLPNGDVLVGGEFEVAGGVPVQNVARWDGSAWHAVGTGADARVTSLASDPRGAIGVGGQFLTFDNQVSAFFARLEPACPAITASYGTSCFGAPTSLHVEAPVFTGGVLRTRVDGVAGSALVLAVLGFAPTQVPLPAILPQGGAGCALLATPDFVQVAAPNGDVARAEVAIPRVAALVGAVLYNQALPISPTPADFVLTASNGQAVILGGMW